MVVKIHVGVVRTWYALVNKT